ncbi:hypothetical protein DL765_010471 [Monosporascus sp. GIB2]|nr:hypothetical protein DL765_010471 [Monosporascus sp. GIB2]
MDSVDLRAFCANLASGQVSSVRIFPNPDDAVQYVDVTWRHCLGYMQQGIQAQEQLMQNPTGFQPAVGPGGMASDFAALGRALWYAATASCSLLCFLVRASLDAVFVMLNLLLWLLCGLLFLVVVLSVYEAAEEKRKAEAEEEAKAKCKDRAEEENEKEKMAEKLGGCEMAKDEEASAGNSGKYWMGDKDLDGSRNGRSSGSARGRKNAKERQAVEMTMESPAKETTSASQTDWRARMQTASATAAAAAGTAAAAVDKAAAAAGNNTAAAGPSSSSSRRRQPTPLTIPPIPTSPSPAPQQQQQPPADGYDWFADLDPKLYQKFFFGDGGSS